MRGSYLPLCKKYYITRKRRLVKGWLYVMVILMKKKERVYSASRSCGNVEPPHSDSPLPPEADMGDKGKEYCTRRLSEVSIGGKINPCIFGTIARRI